MPEEGVEPVRPCDHFDSAAPAVPLLRHCYRKSILFRVLLEPATPRHVGL